MFAFLIVLIVLVAVFIITVVLLQSGKGGGLAAEFGGASSSTDSIMGGRQAANVLTKSSWIGGGVFMALAMIIAIQTSQATTAPSSILRSEFQPTGTPEPVLNTEAPAPIDLDGGAEQAPAEEGGETAPSEDAAPAGNGTEQGATP